MDPCTVWNIVRMGSFMPVEVRMVPSGYGKPPQANLTVFGKATPMVVDRYEALTLDSRVFALVLFLGP